MHGWRSCGSAGSALPRKNCLCVRSLTMLIERLVQVHNIWRLPKWRAQCINVIGLRYLFCRAVLRAATRQCPAVASRSSVTLCVLPWSTRRLQQRHSVAVRQRRSARPAAPGAPDLRRLTFRVVSSLYCQLFTIFVTYADYSFSVAYALMTKKTTELYRTVLERVHD